MASRQLSAHLKVVSGGYTVSSKGLCLTAGACAAGWQVGSVARRVPRKVAGCDDLCACASRWACAQSICGSLRACGPAHAQVEEGAQGYQSAEQKKEEKAAQRGQTDEIEYGMLREHLEDEGTAAAASEDMWVAGAGSLLACMPASSCCLFDRAVTQCQD